MSIYSFDGMEGYATAGILREWTRTGVGSGSSTVTVVTGGRNSGSRLDCYGTGVTQNYAYAYRPVPGGGQTTIAVGFYCEVSSLATATFILDLRDATYSLVLLRVNTDGSISVVRSSSGNYTYDFNNRNASNVLGTSDAGVITAGTPFHLQFKVTIGNDPSGNYELRVDGTNILEDTDCDTLEPTSSSGVSSVGFGFNGAATTRHVYVDDIWIASDFLGDRRVDSHFATGNGTNQDGVTGPSAGGDHHEMIDENPEPDDDTTYMVLDAVDERECYDFDDFKNPGGTIDAVMVVLDSKKEDAGTGSISAHIRESSTNYDGTAQGLTTSYSRVSEVFETDPIATGAWSESNFNSAQFGFHKAA